MEVSQLKLSGIILLSALGLVAFAPVAGAQSFGQYGGADPLPVNARVFGVYLNASDRVIGIMSQLRLSFYPGVDFGFQGGIARTDAGSSDRTTLRLGGDLKGIVSRAGEQGPLDVAIGGHLGVEVGDNFNILHLGPNVVASRATPIGDSGSLVPYASLGIKFARVSAGESDQSDFSFPIRAGIELRTMPEFRFIAELQANIGDDFNDDIGLVAGVNLPF
jgi:hypothetical protein